MIEAKKKKPAATEESAPAAEGPVAPTELPPESVTNESPFEWANKPQEKKTVIDETATKSEVKQKLKDTATAFVTKENNQIKIDRAAFDEIAQQYGVELNWEDLKSGRNLPEAREYVREFVYNAIKDKIAVEKRGERYSTMATLS